MALFLVDSGTLLSQSHYASTPGGAGFQKTTGCLGVWDLVLNCFMVHWWESSYMKQYQEMEIGNIQSDFFFWFVCLFSRNFNQRVMWWSPCTVIKCIYVCTLKPRSETFLKKHPKVGPPFPLLRLVILYENCTTSVGLFLALSDCRSGNVAKKIDWWFLYVESLQNDLPKFRLVKKRWDSPWIFYHSYRPQNGAF